MKKNINDNLALEAMENVSGGDAHLAELEPINKTQITPEEILDAIKNERQTFGLGLNDTLGGGRLGGGCRGGDLYGGGMGGGLSNNPHGRNDRRLI